MNNIKTEITPIPEDLAYTERLCEIRFDCKILMHDFGEKEVDIHSKDPQWFRLNSQITLEAIESESEYALGAQLKQMYYKLRETIERYEQLG